MNAALVNKSTFHIFSITLKSLGIAFYTLLQLSEPAINVYLHVVAIELCTHSLNIRLYSVFNINHGEQYSQSILCRIRNSIRLN